jgi:glucokinase
MYCLAADVGGTKTLLALFARAGDGSYRVVRAQRYESAAYRSLPLMVREFIDSGSEPITSAGIGVSGPVSAGKCSLTNLPWELDELDLAADLGLERVRLVNDFVAVALGISSLEPADLAVLQDGTVEPSGTMAILGAGTGLGEALVISTSAGPTVLPTEGGHAGLAPTNPDEIALLQFLCTKFGRVSWERVLSGPGIKNIYDFLVATGQAELVATRERLEHEDSASVIGELAVAGSDPTCVAAVSMFAQLYGSEAGNFALKSLPTGGVYVAGGIAARVLPILKNGGFISAFNNMGRMAGLMARFRVSVVLQNELALIGACRAALGEQGTSKISLHP